MAERERTDVLVIGAGIVGTACALELARRGAAVTVVDRGEIGHGCSYGNAGWLTPSLANPLPSPGVLLQAARWMLDPESPFYIRLSLRPGLWAWLVRFAAASRRAPYERGTEALTALSKYSLQAYEAWSREFPEPFGFAQRGLLMVTETSAGLAAARHELGLLARVGVRARVLTAEEVRAREPAVTGPIAGGVLFPDEAHVEPLATVAALAAEARRRGARFHPATEVFDFERSRGRIARLLTTRGAYAAERFVLAAGSWSADLGRKLGVALPILGGKGYAAIVDNVAVPPQSPVKILERRIAVTPRAGGLRLAGTLELVDRDDGIAPRRVAAILRGARGVLDLPEAPSVVEVWRGLRPCTPDGMPIIGFAQALPNLLLATGHQMLGLHTAPGTARLATDLLLGDEPAFDPQPFRADRF